MGGTNRTLWITDEDYERGLSECKEKSCNFSELVRMALQLYFDKKDRASNRTVLKVKDA